VDGRITATAIILNLRDGRTPHGAATGVNLTGTTHLGEPIDRRAFFLEEQGDSEKRHGGSDGDERESDGMRHGSASCLALLRGRVACG
jgi:hypothetical protein